jgi:peptidoglycan/LPS O-acetylase OafA/YrhL
LNPFVVLALYAYVVHRPVPALWAFALYAVAAIVGSFALAYVLYISVERPCREWAKRVATHVRRRRSARDLPRMARTEHDSVRFEGPP